MTTTTSRVVREWSPLPLMYKDLQRTVPLTCRFLTLIPPGRIHDVLQSIFGSVICTRGENRPNEAYKNEARDVAAQLPSIEVFKDLLVDKLTRGVVNPHIRKVIFVLALLGVPGRTSLTSEDNTELVAVKQIINEMDPLLLKNSLFNFMFCLIEWELMDRCKMAIKTIDIGFKFTDKQAKVIWCMMALQDCDYVDKQVLPLLRDSYGLWQSDLTHTDQWKDLRTLSRASAVDLATFVLTMWELDFDSNEKEPPWLLELRTLFDCEDSTEWSRSDVMRFFFASYSSHGYRAMAGYHLTIEQRVLFTTEGKNQLVEVFPSPLVFIQDVIFKVK